MADKVTKEKRSEIMSKIRGKNTKIEIVFRKKLWAQGYRYRLHGKMPGKPDIIINKFKVAIFIDGCFWHACPRCKKKLPSTNKKYWKKKIDGNVKRAIDVNAELDELGWCVIRIWEHQIQKDLDGTLRSVIKQIQQGKS